MAQPSAATVEEIVPIRERKTGFSFPPQLPKDGFIEVPNVTAGIYTAVSRAERPLGSSQSIINGRIRDDGVIRRGGYPDYITKPDSNLVMRYIGYKGEENQDWVIRVAAGSLHAASTTVTWSTITGTTYPSFARTTSAQVLGLLFLANLSKKILQVDPNKLTSIEIADVNAPSARFVTSFAERLVAAYVSNPLGGVLPFGLAWSANADPTDWTGLSSGTENLIQSPSDTGDEITGIFAFANLMVILRERSIWHVTRQPFQSAPFRFTPIITNQGCDMPYSAVQTVNEQGNLTGLLFADQRTNGIFQYTPGQRPVRLTKNKIEDQLFTTMTDPQLAKGTYDALSHEYQLGLPTDSSNPERLGKFWVFSAQNGSFVSDDGPICTTIDSVGDVGAPTMIDDLTGFIDALTGTIDALGGVLSRPPIILKADTVGQSIKEDLSTTGTHLLTWESQDLGSISRRRTLKLLTMAITAASSGNTIFEFSKDGTNWTNIKTIADVSSLVKIGFRHQVDGDVIFWRITSLAQQFRFTEWWVKILEKRVKKIS